MRKLLDLKNHIAKLKKAEGAKGLVANQSIIFWGTSEDKAYLPHLKECVGATTVFLRLDKVSTLVQVRMFCKQKGINKVITSSTSLLALLLQWDKRAAPSLSNYAGSYFSITNMEGTGAIEFVVIPPIKQLVTVTYGKFITTRFVTKLTKPETWPTPTEFSWELLVPANIEAVFTKSFEAFMVAVDVETFRENATLRCIGYTMFYYDNNAPTGITSKSYVLPLDSEFNLIWMRKFNWQLPAGKVFQNGKYDISYCARYNAPIKNYLYDTAHLFHSWLSEMPKDLGFLNAFFIRKAFYWKDLATTNDLHTYYKYNALDTWGTGNAWLAMFMEAPDWAINNYTNEFVLNFPCHLAEMTGIARDMSRLEESEKLLEVAITETSKSINTMLAIPAGENFNVNSPKQMKQLLHILGCKDLKSADAKNLEKARYRHPFNAKILAPILVVRKARKLNSTYIKAGKEFVPFSKIKNPRILYSLNPHATDSTRLASREHHFWCGLNIQNIPRGVAVKRTLRADPGFNLSEADLEQAESRDTAYISGEEALIQAVEYSPDFHSANASAFFGVAFEKIFDPTTCKVVDKSLRDLAKRVNHGANYNMGWSVLIDTMGEAKIVLAKKLLCLPKFWGYRAVAEYLLQKFHETYPGIKKVFYTGVINEIATTGLLTSTACHHDKDLMGCDYGTPLDEAGYAHYYKAQKGALVRRCFGNPAQNKRALNSYISHPPQALNAQTLNKAWLAVFKNIVMNKEHKRDIKLLAQIHDSILFQPRINHDYINDLVKKELEIPITIRAYDGKLRTFTVPASVKDGIAGKKAIYWSETE